MEIKRRKTRQVRIGKLSIGSAHPIAIQSMLKVRAKDIPAAIRQARQLEGAGCDIIRLAVEDEKDTAAIKTIKRNCCLPIVADIHFNYRLALASIESGADKVRLNPGNIYRPIEVREVIAAARDKAIPIRIGANSGSLRIRGASTACRLVKSALSYLRIFEKLCFYDIVISLKASNVMDTIAAYRLIARKCDYPLHLGITSTGLPLDGIVKSSLGIGMLLFDGIGDTIRISLLDTPFKEVLVAQSLLSGLGLRHFGPEMVCCPTCGRCEVDLRRKAGAIQAWLEKQDRSRKGRIRPYKIAVMGCVVNGPGEAREADIGIAFSRRKGILFKKGKVVRTVGLDRGEKALLGILKKEMEINCKGQH